MIIPVRRLVTGRDASGRSQILFDGPASNMVEHPAWPGLGATLLWASAAVPANIQGRQDAAEGPFRVMPAAGGVNFTIAQFAPESDFEAMTDEQRRAAREVGDFLDDTVVAADDRLSGMHKTSSVDYDVVLRGRLTLVLDSGEYELGPGDAVIVRGDRHAWRNYGSEPAVMAVVSVSARGLDPSTELQT